MAISPAQARLGELPKLSEEEQEKLKKIEEFIDSQLAKIFGESPQTESVGVALNVPDVPIGYFTPAMTQNLIARYKALGWRGVSFAEGPNNYSVSFIP